MGLRSDLQDLIDLQQLTGQFQQATGGLREQAAQQVFNQQAPGLIDQGQLGQLAGLATQAGQPDIMKTIIEKQLAAKAAAAKTAQAPALDATQLATIYKNVPADAIQVAAGLGNRDDQFKALGVPERGYQAEQGRNAQAGRFTKGQEQAQTFQAGNIIRDSIKNYKAERETLDKATALLGDPSNKPAISSAINSIIKWTAGGGAMSEGDIKRSVSPTFAGTVEEAIAYWKNQDPKNLTPIQIQHLQDTVKTGLKVNSEARQKSLIEATTYAIEQSPELVDKDGKLKPVLAGPLAREGYEFKGYTQENGAQLVKKGEKKTSTVNQNGRSPETKGLDVKVLLDSANALPGNDSFKSQVKSIVDAWDPKGGIPQKIYDDLIARIKAKGGK